MSNTNQPLTADQFLEEYKVFQEEYYHKWDAAAAMVRYAAQATAALKAEVENLKSELYKTREAKDDMFGDLLSANHDNEKLMGLLEERVKSVVFANIYEEKWSQQQTEQYLEEAWQSFCKEHGLN